MIDKVKLTNFRNYKDKSFSFKPGANIVVGVNGAGKTNLLEAIFAALRGGSWRGTDKNLINDQSEWARVDVELANKHIYSLILDAKDGRFKKTRKINDSPKRSGYPPVVLFEPDFIRILTDNPQLRRAWLDDVLSQTDPEYENALKQFNRALKQRNSLLKQHKVSQDHLFVWNLKLTEFGEVISNKRSEFIKAVAAKFVELYSAIAGQSENIKVSYQQDYSSSYGQNYLKKLEQTLERDRKLGFTTSGPHREDMIVEFRGADSQERMSRGEFRTAAIALKQIELDYLADKLGQKPILLLDDILSELDRDRSSRMGILKNRQLIATTTNQTKIKSEFVIEL